MAQKLSHIERDVKKYIEILQTRGIHVEKVILYGSYAGGSPRDGSDVDIIVISSDLDRFAFPERLSFLSKATLSIGSPLEVLGYTPKEVEGKEGNSIFWDEICSTGRILYNKAA